MVELRICVGPSELTRPKSKLNDTFKWIENASELNAPSKLYQSFKEWSLVNDHQILSLEEVNAIYNIISCRSNILSKTDIFITLVELLSYKKNYMISLCAALLKRMMDDGLISSLLTSLSIFFPANSSSSQENEVTNMLQEKITIHERVMIDRSLFSKLVSLNDRFFNLSFVGKWWKFDQCEYSKKLVDELFVTFVKLENYSFNHSECQVNVYPLILFMECLVKTNQHENLFALDYYRNLMILHCEAKGSPNSSFSFFQMKLYSFTVLNIKNFHLQEKLLSGMLKHFSTQIILKCFIYAGIDMLDSVRPHKYILFQKFMFETPFCQNDEVICKLIEVLHKYLLHSHNESETNAQFSKIFNDVCALLSNSAKILQYTDDYVLYLCKVLLAIFKWLYAEKLPLQTSCKHAVLSLVMKLSNSFLSTQNTALKRDLGLFTVETVVSKLKIECKSALNFSYVDSLLLDSLKHFCYNLFNDYQANDHTYDDTTEKLNKQICNLNIDDDLSDQLPKKPTRDIVFLRDCVDALIETTDRDKHEKAIFSLEKLIRRSANETKSLSERLFKLLLNLNNEYNISDFEVCKIHSMAAVIVMDSEVVAKLAASLFYEDNYSLSQRIDILTSISIAAQEIAGRKHSLAATPTPTPSPASNNIPFYCFNSTNPKKLTYLASNQIKTVNNSLVIKSAKERISTFEILFYVLIDVEKAAPLKTLRLFHEDSFMLAHLLKTLNIIVSCSKNFNISVHMCNELLQLCDNFFTHTNSQVRYMTLMSVVTSLDTLSSLPSSLTSLFQTLKFNRLERFITMSMIDVDNDVRNIAQVCVQLLSNIK